MTETPARANNCDSQLEEDPGADLSEAAVFPVQRLGHGDRRPLVLCLPPQVGKLERHGDHGAGREPAVPYHPAAAAEQRADDHRDGEETHAVVAGHPQARDQAPGQRAAAVAGPPDPDHDRRQARPRQQRIQCRVRQMIGRQQHRDRADRSQQLRTLAAAGLAGGSLGFAVIVAFLLTLRR
jgi:hypothetical protein